MFIFRNLWRALRRELHDLEFLALLGFVILIHLGGTFFYHIVEGWRYLDSFYFTVTTLTTVGLGDFAPVTDAGKIFTIIYVFVGIGVILAFVNLVAKHAQANNPVSELLDRRKNYHKN